MSPVLVHVPFFSRSSAVIGDVNIDDSPRTVHHATMGGHVHLDRRQHRLVPGDADAGMAPLQSMATSVDTTSSIGSIASIGSIGSVGSIGSAGSVLSIGSAGSILSIGSAGSILSIGSAGSILSIGSLGSIGAVGGLGQVAGRLVQPAATALGLLAVGTAVMALRSDSG